MPNISEYTDYRKFLQDFYEEAKARNPVFSYQLFSIKAGLKSKGFIYNVIHGKRSISRSILFSLSQAMRLNKYEMEFFENLVAFNQAKNPRESTYYFERLSSIRNSGPKAWKPQIVRSEQYEFYSNVHHSIVRSIIGMFGFRGDYQWLAKRVYPRITPGQAKKSVALLERLGFIEKQKDGSYVLTEATIATPDEVLGVAVFNFHRQAGALALKALNELPRDKRNITGVTLGISKETYTAICEELQAFRTRLLQIAETDRNADEVYHLNLQFFPMSKSVPERDRP
jgi:uncharacterized protein (TIGR02147 family)